MRPINDEIKLQFAEKNNKNWELWEIFEKVIINFKTTCYELTASSNIVH